jgi:hypothetical protein
VFASRPAFADVGLQLIKMNQRDMVRSGVIIYLTIQGFPMLGYMIAWPMTHERVFVPGLIEPPKFGPEPMCRRFPEPELDSNVDILNAISSIVASSSSS